MHDILDRHLGNVMDASVRTDTKVRVIPCLSAGMGHKHASVEHLMVALHYLNKLSGL